MTVNGLKSILEKLILEGQGQKRIEAACPFCPQETRGIDKVRVGDGYRVIIWLDKEP